MSNKSLVVSLAAVLLMGTTAVVAANSAVTANSQMEQLQALKNYGYTHVNELEWDDHRPQLEVEGWLADNWFAEVTFQGAGAAAEVKHERKESKIVQPWGLTLTQVEQVMQQANSQGMAVFEEISIDDSGRIEIEGDNANGRELELRFHIREL
ncbi:hypothetical protein ACQ661_05085 [Pseudidiomarina sp. WS423]|uniref:hypothetical protein n=1 Tax=Pseudidiomarina sp. WS423 TaxID=3425124 RepID=UPI003D6DF902